MKIEQYFNGSQIWFWWSSSGEREMHYQTMLHPIQNNFVTFMTFRENADFQVVEI